MYFAEYLRVGETSLELSSCQHSCPWHSMRLAALGERGEQISIAQYTLVAWLQSWLAYLGFPHRAMQDEWPLPPFPAERFEILRSQEGKG